MTFKISDPDRSIPRYLPSGSGRNLSEPVLAPDRPQRSSRAGSESHSPTRRNPFRWLGVPGRFRFRQAQPAREYWAEAHAGSGQGARSRPPFDRLKFWTVSHELVHRLMPYEAKHLPLMFRFASWDTLVFWSRLLDQNEAKEPVKV